MPINCDPALYDYAPPALQVVACWAAGKTPEDLYLCLTGIEIGPLWAAPNPPPPNGVYKLTTTVKGRWDATIDGIHYSYVQWPLNSVIDIDVVAGPKIFFGFAVPLCIFSLDNTLNNPAVNPYLGGSGVLLSPLQDTIESIQTVLNELGIDPTGDTFDLPRPISGDETVHTIFRRSDASNCHILYDHS